MPVPVDYAQPDGEQVGIAVMFSPALGDNPSHRALVVNFGGPGDAGTDTLRYFVDELPAEIRNAFDIVSFDPRGVGSSRPIRCISAADADKLYAADPTADTAAELPGLLRRHRVAGRSRPGLHRPQRQLARRGRHPERRP